MKRNKYQATRLVAITGGCKIYNLWGYGRKRGEQAGTQGVTGVGARPAPNHRCSKYHVLPLISKQSLFSLYVVVKRSQNSFPCCMRM